MISNFTSLCKTEARETDKAIFMQWEKGEINTLECLKRFMNHNRCFVDISDVDITAFALWLRSLGYIRRYRL